MAGQELEASAGTEREGYAVITKGLYGPEQQVQSGASGAYGDPAFQELFFQVSSEKAADLIWYFPKYRRKAGCTGWILR